MTRRLSIRRSNGSLHLPTLAALAGLAAGCAMENGSASDEAVVDGVVARSFQDDVAPSNSYAATRDTTLQQNAPTVTSGTSTTLRADGDDPAGSSRDLVALIKWDLSSIPAGSTVQGASLTVHVANASAGSYTLYALRRNWTELGASWNERSPGNPWELPGARGASDRDATALGTIRASATGACTVTLNAAGVAQVQAWIDDPSTNFGFVLANASNTDGLDMASREATTAAQHPRFTVRYVPPGTADAGSADSGTDAAAADAGIPAACSSCTHFGPMTTPGTITDARLHETSGIAASRRNAGVLYVHNDSGDSARFFAISDAARVLREFRVTNATARDWEDVAVGPCPQGSCVYIADVGDNARARTEYQIYRVAEPSVAVGSTASSVDVSAERFAFMYPDGSHNCETLMIHPSTGDLYMVTKNAPEDAFGDVFRLTASQLQAGVRATPSKLARITLPAAGAITGGDIHPCASRFLLRAGGSNYEFTAAAGAPFASVFTATPRVLPELPERQCEAIAYRADATGYFTISEGTDPALHASRCQ